ncbi:MULTISPECIES: hypothetical protein [Eikenella]|uniref:hypothetical protein n=1 Tax=Eikenella TaxID=538 RepID=UPI0012E83707|nr:MULTISPECIES: hypothetical protein [Eikenella]
MSRQRILTLAAIIFQVACLPARRLPEKVETEKIEANQAFRKSKVTNFQVAFDLPTRLPENPVAGTPAPRRRNLG